jgi:hypothetical protein
MIGFRDRRRAGRRHRRTEEADRGGAAVRMLRCSKLSATLDQPVTIVKDKGAGY